MIVRTAHAAQAGFYVIDSHTKLGTSSINVMSIAINPDLSGCWTLNAA
jgi:hypothetical protein